MAKIFQLTKKNSYFSDNEPATMDESGIFVEKDPSTEKTQTDKPKIAKKEKRHSTSSSSTQTSDENAGNGIATAGNSNVEIDDCSAELREACGGLVMRKKETEAEIEGCKEQIR